MWFRRRRRSPPPVVLPSLDRLAEVIERVVALLDHVTLAPPQPPPRLPGVQEMAALRESPAAEPTAAAGHVLFLSTPDGYRLIEDERPPPGPGNSINVGGVAYAVLREGPSPLPGDRRRCVFVERQEPPRVERTPDA